MQVKLEYLSFILFFVTSSLLAQLDNSKEIKTDMFNYQPDKKSNNEELSLDFSKSSTNKGETITLFGMLEDLAKNMPELSVKGSANNQSIFDSNKLDSDILVKKFWQGKDVSMNKIKTEVELGKIETTTKRIRIECRDHSYVDGDRVRLIVNEQIVRSNIVLKAGYYILDINLKEGFNRIDIEALNQGLSGPNTAEFNVYDGNGNLLASKDWNILTGYVATLVVIKN